MSDGMNERLRALPSIDHVMDALEESSAPRAARVGAARAAVDAARDRIRKGEAVGPEEVVAAAGRLLEARETHLLQPVINATGVLIHTNLGRASLGEAQLAEVERIGAGYSNLEYDLEAGERGTRYSHAAALVSEATGAEAALVVNNNAAAVLLCLSALFRDREVVISRGELVEIGGEFRIPDVMALSGAKLVEVGTTNRTRVADYERAIGPDTAAILKVHPSNYRVVGFTQSVPVRDLARLARGRGVCLMYDVGSGYLGMPEHESLRDEPSVRSAIEDGAELVTFSGDKLLGGPQAGVIAGRRDLIEALSRHPLLRALRVDKITLAALQATLGLHLGGMAQEIPLWMSLLTPIEELEERATRLSERVTGVLPNVKAEVQRTTATIGGGSAPGSEISSIGVTLAHPERSTGELERALRRSEPPVIARTDDDRVTIELRTVFPEQDDALLASLLSALS